MNSRRSFFKQLAVGAAAFAILPSAETYGRIWKPKAIVPVRYEINPEWANAKYEVFFTWNKSCILERGVLAPSLPEGNPFPPRFVLKDGKFIQVPTFVEA